MRLSRNRNWAHPNMIALLERLATEAKRGDGWNGLLVGDLAQPRGGPMLDGHASHQIGLDADVWLTPMPDRTLTREERETIKAKLVVKDRKTMDYGVWTEAHARLIRRAASYPQVERIFVHPPIKAELCRWASGNRSWLAKVRPIYGHNYHFHIRIKCPSGSAGCKPQGAPAPVDGTGCGKELAYWMGEKPWAPPKKRDPSKKPPKPPPPLTLSALPADCRGVVTAD
jgi:penicillin-insensitive murein DD-endopeptidase